MYFIGAAQRASLKRLLLLLVTTLLAHVAHAWFPSVVLPGKTINRWAAGTYQHRATAGTSSPITSPRGPRLLTASATMDSESESDSDESLEPPSKLIDGKAIAAQVRDEVAQAVKVLAAHSARYGPPIVPGLAVVLVGNRPDSSTYVRMKRLACEQVGILDLGVDLPADVPQETLLATVARLNADPRVHGVLVQLPLPPHLDEAAVLASVSPRKDVDGLHPQSLAALATTQTHKNTTTSPPPQPPLSAMHLATPKAPAAAEAGTPLGSRPTTAQEKAELAAKNKAKKERERAPDPTWTAVDFCVPCTPLGCVELLDRTGIELAGATACVVGRSNVVGLPLALLLMQRDATVTVVHSKTVDPAAVCRQADLVFVAAGRPGLVTGDWIKPGAVVIDVGIHSVPDPRPPPPKPKRRWLQNALPESGAAAAGRDQPSSKNGARTMLVGDVDFASVEPRCALITPVPGGVGPMTVAMLLRNTLQAARRFSNARADRAPGWGAFEHSAPEEAAALPVAPEVAEKAAAAPGAVAVVSSSAAPGAAAAEASPEPKVTTLMASSGASGAVPLPDIAEIAGDAGTGYTAKALALVPEDAWQEPEEEKAEPPAADKSGGAAAPEKASAPAPAETQQGSKGGVEAGAATTA